MDYACYSFYKPSQPLQAEWEKSEGTSAYGFCVIQKQITKHDNSVCIEKKWYQRAILLKFYAIIFILINCNSFYNFTALLFHQGLR